MFAAYVLTITDGQDTHKDIGFGSVPRSGSAAFAALRLTVDGLIFASSTVIAEQGHAG